MTLPPDLAALKAAGFDVVEPLRQACAHCSRLLVMRAGQRFCSRACKNAAYDWARSGDPDRTAKAKARYDRWYAIPGNAEAHRAQLAKRKKFIRTYCKDENGMSQATVTAGILSALKAHGGQMTAAQLGEDLSTRSMLSGFRTLYEAGEIELVVRLAGQEFGVDPVFSPSLTGPWLEPSPEAPRNIPGGLTQLHWLDNLDRPVGLRDSVLLHGALCHAIGVDHDRTQRAFALSPGSSGDWWVQWFVPQGELLAGQTMRLRLGDRKYQVKFGSLLRPRSPAPYAPGMYRVRIDALTPVAIMRGNRESGKQLIHSRPSAPSIIRALVAEMTARLGFVQVQERQCQMHFIEAPVRWERIDTGGHVVSPADGVGKLSGWVGTVEAYVNAPVRWMLEAAARGLGLGSKRAYGLGRITVRDVEAPRLAELQPVVPVDSVAPKAAK